MEPDNSNPMRTNSTMETDTLDELESDILDALESAGGFFERERLRSRLEAVAEGREFPMLPGKQFRQAAEGKPLPGPNPHPAAIPSKAELEQWRETVESPGPRLALQRISPHFRFERTGTKRFKVCDAQQARIRDILARSEGNQPGALQTPGQQASMGPTQKKSADRATNTTGA
jgi:hypothetical protein